MATNDQTRWPRVNMATPCPVCGKPDACKISPDGAVAMCKRTERGSFKEIKGWYFHRLIERPRPDGGNGQSRNMNGTRAYTPAAQSNSPKAFRTFDDAAKAAAKVAGGIMAGQWAYYNADGSEFASVVRFNLRDGGKQFRPIYNAKDGWRIGDPPGQWPLYRANELPATGTVWVCEGEKATDAAVGLGLPTVTSAHGSSAAEKTDWSPVANLDVVIVIDADDAGRKYGRDVATILFKENPAATVKMLALPGLPAGGDIVEFIDARDSRDSDEIRGEVVALADATPFIAAADLVGGAVTRCLADVQAERISWLWPSRFALGKLSLIGGVPGVGKSWLSLYIAAAISRAMAWPDGRGNAPLGSVLIANAEDGAADTIKPRLEAMGADCRRVHILDCVQRPGENGRMVEFGFTLAMAGDLEAAIKRVRPTLIVIDPLSAFAADANEYKNGEMRMLLKPLSRLAEKYRVAIIFITHLTKNGGANSVHRMIGSIAVAAACRSVWMIAKDSKDDNRRLLLLAKCNIAADEGGLAYAIVDGSIAFEAGAVTQSADDVLAEQNGAEGAGRPPDERTAAEAWLKSELADGLPRKVADILAAANDAGIATGSTLRRAAAAMGIERKLPGFGAGWTWRLPQSGQNPIQGYSDQTAKTVGTPPKTAILTPSQISPINTLFVDQTGAEMNNADSDEGSRP